MDYVQPFIFLFIQPQKHSQLQYGLGGNVSIHYKYSYYKLVPVVLGLFQFLNLESISDFIDKIFQCGLSLESFL